MEESLMKQKLETLIAKVKRLGRRIMAFIPTKLPVGMTEFDAWASDIADLYNAPNNDSVKFSLAVMIMHLGPTEARKAKEYFGRTLHKGAATQVAHAIMQELKEKQKKAEAEAVVVPNEQPKA